MKMEQSPQRNKPYWHLGLLPPSQECGDPPLGLPAPPAESFLISAWRPNMCHPIRTSAFGLSVAHPVLELPGSVAIVWGSKRWPDERPE
ncbi:hypothetical protein GQ607_006328 [Colletotrichum asianum]|uniref:Uncharacterized protein n=1 Tax=Colletotrichum asianum TaxID=702518 RepID=A0A8H3WED0_9PEZI|nr:hypothetical protein GQ607_006328 [Colletotrichum asianum]